MITNQLKIQNTPLAALKPYAQNARTHSKKQIKQIAESIRKFGFVNPALIDSNNIIIAGHGRVEAAKMLGMDNIPAIKVEHLTEDEKRAYIMADNRLAELAGWDESILAIELQHLLEVKFDATITGFEMPKIDLIIQNASKSTSDEDDFDPAEELPIVTKPGDLWQLGEHRILCGNALKPDDYHILMQGEKAQLVFTDVPYNVPIKGHVCGLGEVQHKEFAMASGEMSKQEFTEFLYTAFKQLTANTQDGSIHFQFIDWRHIGELMAAGERVYSELKAVCVWNKTNGGMGSLYRSKHEMSFVYKYGTAPHINNIELGKHGRNRTNVWDYAGQNTFRADREEELAMHPTVKPVALVADAILDCSHRKGLVLDPFGGSGTTLIAAQKTGRRARLIELEPRYVDVTIRRWQKLTEKKAINILTQQQFV